LSHAESITAFDGRAAARLKRIRARLICRDDWYSTVNLLSWPKFIPGAMILIVASETGVRVTDKELACVTIRGKIVMTIAATTMSGSTIRQYLLRNIPIKITPIYAKRDPYINKVTRGYLATLPVGT
jgi:hypothetical protein